MDEIKKDIFDEIREAKLQFQKENLTIPISDCIAVINYSKTQEFLQGYAYGLPMFSAPDYINKVIIRRAT